MYGLPDPNPNPNPNPNPDPTGAQGRLCPVSERRRARGVLFRWLPPPFVLWPAAALFHALCPPSMHATRTHLDLDHGISTL